MKKNSKKLLLSLFSPEEKREIIVAESLLRELLTNLSDSGFLSLKRLLLQEKLIWEEKAEVRRYRLSERGKAAVLALYPYLDPSMNSRDSQAEVSADQPHWSVILFTQPPKADLQFRYLRSQCLKNGCLALNRGVYLYPGQLPDQLLTTIQRLYLGSVVVFGSSEVIQGDSRQLSIEGWSLTDVASILSGISREIKRVTEAKKSFSAMKYQEKKLFLSLFDRIFEATESYVPLVQKYFPDVAKPGDLLGHWQRLADTSEAE